MNQNKPVNNNNLHNNHNNNLSQCYLMMVLKHVVHVKHKKLQCLLQLYQILVHIQNEPRCHYYYFQKIYFCCFCKTKIKKKHFLCSALMFPHIVQFNKLLSDVLIAYSLYAVISYY
eukprot:UN10846